MSRPPRGLISSVAPLACVILACAGVACGADEGSQRADTSPATADATADAPVGRDVAADITLAPGEVATDVPTSSPRALTLSGLSVATPGVPTPIIVDAGAPIDVALTLLGPDGVARPLRLYRGRGSATVVIPGPGDATFSVAGGDWYGELTIAAQQDPGRQISGDLAGDALAWGAGERIVVSADATVPADATLTIGAGAQVLVAAGASIVILGALDSQGTSEQPVLFSRADDAPWGGIRVLEGGTASATHTFFVGGGGDHRYDFGHSNSQPVVFVQGAQLTMTGGGVLDAPGKAFGADGARVVATAITVARVDTGGEFERSQLRLADAHISEIPDADAQLDDDDNDGLYLVGVMNDADGEPLESTVSDTVFANGEDDAIDHNDAVVRVERCWIDGFAHEGVAASNGHRITVVDTVVRGCEQGIEAGYGTPEVIVDHCLVTANDVGLRFGDNYDWGANGKLSVSHTISVGNRILDLKNFDTPTAAARPDGIVVSCSIIGADPAQPEGDWSLTGCATGPLMTSVGCDGTAPGPRGCQ